MPMSGNVMLDDMVRQLAAGSQSLCQPGYKQHVRQLNGTRQPKAGRLGPQDMQSRGAGGGKGMQGRGARGGEGIRLL